MNFNLDIEIPISKFLEKTGAKIFNDFVKNYKIKKVVTDTRNYDNKGGIFFAIKGKTFDGHKFVEQIIKSIDYVVISDENVLIEEYKKKFILVKDTTIALDNLANLYRKSFPKLKVISVAGSNGKTTTKEIIKYIFEKKYNIVATEGNLNNLLGTAYTLFPIKKTTEFCIVEVGISIPGEMKILGETVSPDVVVFTNIGKEHLEYFCNTENVFKEETEILKHLQQKGFIVINKDDEYLSKIYNGKCEKKYYSINNNTADVYCNRIVLTNNQTEVKVIVTNMLGVKIGFDIKTKLLGLYNVYNILAGTTTAFYCGIDDVQLISDSINNFIPLKMRGKSFEINGNKILDESYNANPDSMKYTITEFTNIFKENKKYLVLGDMLELGEHSQDEHKNILNYIDLQDVKGIFLFGKEIKFLYNEGIKINKKKFLFYEDIDSLKKDLFTIIKEKNNCAILFKASRGIGLDKVVEYLLTQSSIPEDKK